MANETLLDIVQEFLSDTDADPVNNISDTVESMQYATVIRSIYDDVVTTHDIMFHERLVNLTATGVASPYVMERPEGLYEIEWIKYNSKQTAGGDQDYKLIKFMEPDDFLCMVQARTASDANMTEYTYNSVLPLAIQTDKAPEYWTILQGFDDIIFDSFDSALETNLQASKSLCRGTLKPTLALTNTAVLDLPKNYNPMVKNLARAYIFETLNDRLPATVALRARRSEIRGQRERYITKGLQDKYTGPDYGRK
jgi:hypothetical protein